MHVRVYVLGFYCTVSALFNVLCVESTWDEQEDVLTIGSQVFPKPFVEKPVSAEDHNVHIYFPSAVGGGSQQLFRKVSTCIV